MGKLAIGWMMLASMVISSSAAAQDETVEPPADAQIAEVPPPPSAALASPSLAYAPPSAVYAPPPEEDWSLRLDAWLVLHARRAEGARYLVGGAGLAVGLVIIPVEAFLISNLGSGETLITAIACLGIGLGVIDLALGIFQLASPSIQERRLSRWRAVRARGSVRTEEIARFEGEIRGELAIIEEARWVAVALGAGLAAAGIVGVGLTAGLARDEVTELIGYAGSAAAGLLGLLIAILPWLDTTADDEWREIEAGNAPRVSSIVPWVSPWGGGLTSSGTF